jgi:hypothetical protein
VIAIPRVIRRPMHGPDVEAWRRALIRANLRSAKAPHGETLAMGAQLEEETRHFQRVHGIPPSGVVGQLTFNKAVRLGLYLGYELRLVEKQRAAMRKTHANLVAGYVIQAAVISADTKHEPSIHYSQDENLRWRGIHFGWIPPVFPDFADCSSMFTWLRFEAMLRAFSTAGPDTINGTRWLSGFTGTMMSHGKPVALKNAVPGLTACFYSTRKDKVPTHVAVFVGTLPGHGPDCIVSHGQENGPRIAHVNYRTDYVGSRVYPVPAMP